MPTGRLIPQPRHAHHACNVEGHERAARQTTHRFGFCPKPVGRLIPDIAKTDVEKPLKAAAEPCPWFS